jgi:glycosyltransferase involved in cell wall biosynthesis
MKILFLFHGTTHYFNLITSQINKKKGIEILYIYPKTTSDSMGAGVFQTREGANFQFVELEEKRHPEKSYSYFVGLNQFVADNKPDIILCDSIYLESLFFDESLRALFKRLNIKVILKSIPFQIKKYNEVIEEFENKIKNTSLPPFNSFPVVIRKLLKFLKFDFLYKRVYMDRKAYKNFWKKLHLKKDIYNFPDGHVNYIEDAYAIYGSYGVPKEKIFITYNSPDTDLLFSIKEKIEKESPVLAENNFRFIHLSRLVEWKRVDMLIKAVKNLKEKYPQVELLVVGEGPEKENLINLAVSLGVKDSVKFLGGIYDTSVLGKYLMSSSIYTLAGMGGLSINDAMVFGLPVICSVCDGTEKYLVREDYNGLYFENGDQESLEAKIKYLFDNPEKRLKMGENSLSIIKNEINIHTVVGGYLNAFKYVTKTK